MDEPLPHNQSDSQKQEYSAEEPVWTYRGYRLKTSEFVTAMVHFFRAEVTRANVWRQRLDATTNWAVISVGATLSIAFSQASVHHSVILLNMLLVCIFLYIEGRRYRYYELWSYRVRLMETDFFAAMLVAPFHPSPDWAEGLAETLLSPSFPISAWEAVGRRLRHNYIWIFAILGAAWVAKCWLYPFPLIQAGDFFDRAVIGNIPGSIVSIVLLAFYLFLFLFSILTAPLQHASGEVLPRFGTGFPSESSSADSANKTQPWFGFRKKREQFIAFIITGQPELVSKMIISDLNRGVTAVDGKGMYTSHELSVLMCAITVTEINNLKKVVAEQDSKAFVVVTPAKEILGRGFNPLTE